MRPSRRGRVGIIYLEIHVAMVVLGIGLAGLCPLVLAQLKLLRKLESPDPSTATPRIIRGVRMVDGQQYVRGPDAPSEALVPMIIQPQPDAWSRRLGVPASIGITPTSQKSFTTPSQQSVAVGDSGFSAINWTLGQAPSPIGTGVYWRSKGDAAVNPATWHLTNIAPGYYRVFATWSSNSPNLNATDATYTLTNAVGVPGNSSQVDQSVAPLARGLEIFQLGLELRFGYDLQLMSWGDGSGVPSSGNNLVIVGTDNNGLLYIRIFDAGGSRVRDTNEILLPSTETEKISTLKEQLPGLLSPHLLTYDEKFQVLGEVTSIVGQDHYVELAVSDSKRVVADAIRIIPLNNLQILPNASAPSRFQVSVVVTPQ